MAHPEAALPRPGTGPLRNAAVQDTGAAVAEQTVGREEPGDEARLRRIFDDHFTFVWRYLRRMGLSSADADDAAQQVFVVLSRKLDRVEPGKEKAFLCGTAIRVCSEVRRARSRRREVHEVDHAELVDHRLGPDAVADRERARVLLDRVLDQMDDALRTVFVLFEIEELSTAEIATIVDVPSGTAASRLRRAREQFRAIMKRMRAGGQLPEEVR